MSWLQISLLTTSEKAHNLCDLMSLAGANTVTMLAANAETIYETPGDASVIWSSTRVVGLFDEATDTDHVLKFLRTSLDLPELTDFRIERLDDQVWQEKWKENSQPLCFGTSLWIYPSWYTGPHVGRANIVLDPGLAFGSGTHPTTSMCLEWLDQHDINGWDIIDYGCGSGVLAIAAIKLGATHAWAVDIDPQALQATSINAMTNDVSQQITPLLPDELSHVKANCLIANILANPIVELVATFADLLPGGGHLVLSGILSSQTDDILTAIQPFFDLDTVHQSEQWVRIYARRQTQS